MAIGSIILGIVERRLRSCDILRSARGVPLIWDDWQWTCLDVEILKLLQCLLYLCFIPLLPCCGSGLLGRVDHVARNLVCCLVERNVVRAVLGSAVEKQGNRLLMCGGLFGRRKNDRLKTTWAYRSFAFSSDLLLGKCSELPSQTVRQLTRLSWLSTMQQTPQFELLWVPGLSQVLGTSALLAKRVEWKVLRTEQYCRKLGIHPR